MSCSSYAASFCRRIHAAACIEHHLCSSSHTPALTPPHLYCSIHTAAFFRRSHAVALMPSHATAYFCRRIHAFPCTQPFLCRSKHAAAFTPLSRRSIDAVALTPQHWCRSFDAAASHAAFFGRSISPPTSRCSIHISPKEVCDGEVKNRGWGWKSRQKETPSGQKETPSGQFVRKMGKSALELGQKKSIIQPSTVNLQLGNPQPTTLNLTFTP